MQNLFSFFYYLSLIFSIWMGIDCIRRKDNVFAWLFAIFIFHPFGSIFYFFKVKKFRIPLPSISVSTSVMESDELKHLKAQVKTIGGPYQYEQLGLYYLKENQMESAQKYLSIALEKNSESLIVKYGLGKSLFALGKFMEAANILEEIIQKDPNYDYGNALFGIAECYRMAGEDNKALGIYEKVYRLSSFFKSNVRYAELLKKNNRIDEALKVIHAVIEGAKNLPKYKYDKEIFWIKKAEMFIEKNPKP